MPFKRLFHKWKNCIRLTCIFYSVVTIVLLMWVTTDKMNLFIKRNTVRNQRFMSGHRVKVIPRFDKTALQPEVIPNTVFNQTVLISNIFQGREICNGSIVSYQQQFATFHPIVVDFRLKVGRVGGENVSEVINQSEKAEYLNLKHGFFQTSCSEQFQLKFSPKNHLSSWSGTLQKKDVPFKYETKMIPGWTIAVMRYEYANLYHTMTDFYNAFLLMIHLKINPANLTILWIDSHPVGALDQTWSALFGKVLRTGNLNNTLMFEHFAWNILGYDSILNKHDLPKLPLLEDFRTFFLSRHDIPTAAHARNCTKLNVLFIWRRDYVAHPRNPSGLVSRKIQNENELISAMQDLLPGHNVHGVQIDKLSMREQLILIGKTDILIGMHGAGLTHTLFLPKTSGLVEIYPMYWPMANKHFRAMSRWRGLFYQNMQNKNAHMEKPKHYTIVNSETLVNIVHEMHHKMCGDVHGA